MKKKYARLSNGVVVDVITTLPEESMHPSLAKEFEEVADDVERSWEKVKGVLTKPVSTPEPEPEPNPVQPVITLSVPDILFLFSWVERNAFRKSNDPLVQDFVTMLADPRLTSLTLPSKFFTEAVAQMQGLNILSPARAAAILSATPY